jgi:hypothetical protein
MEMRLTLPDGTIAEGTPEELSGFRRLSQFHSLNSRDSERVDGVTCSTEEDFTFVSESIANRVLSRLRLSPAQAKMLKLMYRNGEKWTNAPEIQKEIGYSASQFAGLMGAFGRRVAYTPGYVSNSRFFECDWDYTNECYRYRLPSSVNAALESIKLV